MSDPGFTPLALCSTFTAGQQAVLTGAVRVLLSASRCPLPDDHPLAPLASDIARALVAAGCHRTRQLGNAALGGALRSSGYNIKQLGTGGGWPITARRSQRTGTRR